MLLLIIVKVKLSFYGKDIFAPSIEWTKLDYAFQQTCRESHPHVAKSSSSVAEKLNRGMKKWNVDRQT